MADRTFALTSARRADFGPRQKAQEIICAACGASDQVIDSSSRSSMPPEVVARKFREAGWVVGKTARGDRCPKCAGLVAPPRKTRETPPMTTEKTAPAAAAARSADAVLARKICDDLLMEQLDLEARAYRPGWSDERIAKESGWSVEAVKRRREADWFAISEAVRPEAIAEVAKGLAEGLAAIGKAVERLGAVALEEVAARQSLQAAVTAMRDRVAAVERLAKAK